MYLRTRHVGLAAVGTLTPTVFDNNRRLRFKNAFTQTSARAIFIDVRSSAIIIIIVVITIVDDV